MQVSGKKQRFAGRRCPALVSCSLRVLNNLNSMGSDVCRARSHGAVCLASYKASTDGREGSPEVSIGFAESGAFPDLRASASRDGSM